MRCRGKLGGSEVAAVEREVASGADEYESVSGKVGYGAPYGIHVRHVLLRPDVVLEVIGDVAGIQPD